MLYIVCLRIHSLEIDYCIIVSHGVCILPAQIREAMSGPEHYSHVMGTSLLEGTINDPPIRGLDTRLGQETRRARYMYVCVCVA